MKALCYDKYGPPEVVHVGEVEKPVPGDDELLVKVHATTVTTADWRLRSLEVPSPVFSPLVRLAFGVFSPRKKVLGTECAGRIEAAGRNVTRFQVGEGVFVSTGTKLGAHAEYVVVRESGLVAKKPPNLSFEEAAALSFGGLTALHFLRDLGRIQRGSRVLVVGASGAVGTFAVQLAKILGAHVAGVCSAKNVALVNSLGADRVFDYETEDFTKSGESYDIILDTVGKETFERCRASLTTEVRFLAVLLGAREMAQIVLTAIGSKKKAVSGTTVETVEGMVFLSELAREGKLKVVIDRTFAFEDAVAAHRRVDSGHKVGSVVLSLGPFSKET